MAREGASESPSGSGAYDFAFALGNPGFSDCTLRLHVITEPPSHDAESASQAANSARSGVCPPAKRSKPDSLNQTEGPHQQPERGGRSSKSRRQQPERVKATNAGSEGRGGRLTKAQQQLRRQQQQQQHQQQQQQQQDREGDDVVEVGEAGGKGGKTGRASHQSKRQQQQQQQQQVEGGDDRVGGGEVVELCANSAILAAKSAYFKRMFEGGFRESSGKRVVNIQIPHQEKEVFMNLMSFVYTCALPLGGDNWGVAEILQLLVLADRFDVQDCVAQCGACLRALWDAKTLKLADAWSLLDLPESLQEAPGVFEILEVGKSKILEAYAQQINDDQLDDAFFSLPDCRLRMLLEEDSLEVSSEDKVVDAVLAWAMRQHPSDEARLNALVHVVWPGVRVRFLSPQKALELVEETLSLLYAPRGRNPQPTALNGGSAATAQGSVHSPLPGCGNPQATAHGPSLGYNSPQPSAWGPSAGQPPTTPHSPPQPTAWGPLGGHSPPQPSAHNSLGASSPQASAQNASVGGAAAQPSTHSPSMGGTAAHNLLLGSNPPQASAHTASVGGTPAQPSAHSPPAGYVDTMRRFSAACAQCPDRSLVLCQAEEEHCSVLAAAICGFCSGQLIHAGLYPAQGFGVPQVNPRQGYSPPSGTFHLDIPQEECRGLEFRSKPVQTGKQVIAGRWLAFESQLIDGSPPTFGVYITTDKRSFEGGVSESFLMKSRFSIMTAGSEPHYELRPHSDVMHEFCKGGADSWGRSDFLGMPWQDVLEEHEEYFPKGVLRLRADVWLQ